VASACSDDSPAGPDAAPLDAAPGGIEIPRGASLPPLAYTLTLTYVNPPFILQRPETITGHLYLDVAADGVVSGTIAARDIDTVSLAAIDGRVEGTEIVCQDAMVAVTPGGSLELGELRLSLLDGDGDGAVDGAQGEAAGSWSRGLGDVFDQTPYSSTLTAGLDARGTTASLSVPRSTLTLLPFDAVNVRFEEPLRETDVRDHLRILAGGTAVTGELTLAATGGLVTGATFQPDAFLAFGADVTIDHAGLEDPSGNALAAPDARVPVVADPGALTDNAGFESELAGWIALGQTGVEGAFQGIAPAEGAAQAVVREGGTLAIALDVGAGATELELSVAVLTEGSEVDANHTAVIALRTPGGELMEIFDVADVADQLQDCAACTATYSKSVGPLRRTIDLTPHRGQRVFLTVDVRSSFFIGVNFFAALVDDIQIR
jgi:hypothetical protein